MTCDAGCRTIPRYCCRRSGHAEPTGTSGRRLPNGRRRSRMCGQAIGWVLRLLIRVGRSGSLVLPWTGAGA